MSDKKLKPKKKVASTGKKIKTTRKEEEEEEEAKGLIEKLVKQSTDKVEKEYAEKFETWKKEQKEKMAVKAGVYAPEAKEKRAGLNDYLRKFLTALRWGDTATLKDMSSTPADGGYTIDDELSAEIETLTTQYGVFRRESNLVTLSKGDLKINNLATDIDVYWTDEAAAKTSDQVTVGQVTLSLKKLAVIVPMTDELLEDTEIDLVGYVTSRIAENMAREEDEQFFNGSGSPFTGVLQDTNVNVVTMASTSIINISADDLINMVDATPQGALANGKYYLNRTIMSFIRKLKSDDGIYVYQAPSAQGPATVWGYPVVDVEAMPNKSADAANTGFVIFGDLRKGAWMGQKAGGMRVALSTEATIRNTDDDADINLFRQDMTALRVVERVGYVLVLPKALTVLKTNSASV